MRALACQIPLADMCLVKSQLSPFASQSQLQASVRDAVRAVSNRYKDQRDRDRGRGRFPLLDVIKMIKTRGSEEMGFCSLWQNLAESRS